MNFLTDEERALLLKIPSDETAVYRVYTLAPHELKFIRRANFPHSKVDRALHLALLKWPGGGFRLGEPLPPDLIAFLCKQLRLPKKAFQPGGRIGQSHTRMARDVADFLGMKAFAATHIPLMTQWAEDEATHTNNKLKIVAAILNGLRQSKIIIPAWDTIERAAQAGMWAAKEASLKAINSYLDDTQKRKLDLLVINDIRFRSSPLAWLRSLNESAKVKHFHALLSRIEYLRQLKIPADISEAITPWKYSRLKQRGNRARPIDIVKYSNDLRHAVLAVQVVHLSKTFSDGAVRMFSSLTKKQFETAIRINKERFAESKEDGIDVWMAYREAASALQAVRNGEDVDIAVDSTLGGWEEVRDMDDKAAVLVNQSTQDKLLTASERFTSFSHFVPAFLDSFAFAANSPEHPILRAIEIVRDTFQSKAKSIPDDAPVAFLPRSWQRMVKVEGKIDRKRYITAVTSAVQERLHSGDLNVEGSSSYLSLDQYLVPANRVAELAQRLPLNANANDYLAERKQHLHRRLTTFQEKLLDGAVEGVRLVNGRLSISPIKGEPVPGLEAAGNKIDRLMPQKQIADVFHEIHEQTGVFDCFTNSEGRCYDDIRVVMAAVWAIASGLGLEHMAMASPSIELAQLEWVASNFITDENFDRAIARLAAYQRSLPFARYVGDAGLSSSDGQFIPVGQRPVGAGTYNPQHGAAPGVVHYTFVNGQYLPFHTKVLSASEPEAVHVLDGLVYRGSGLGEEAGEGDHHIREHSTDTGGATDQLFGGFRMINVRFRPRYRNMPRLRFGYIGSSKPYKRIATLVGAPINTQLIKDNWQGILRVGVSFAEGAVLPSLIFRRFSAYRQENQLSAAFGEFGRIDRTDFMLDYLEDPVVRKDTQIRLNKGEAEHLLRDAMRLGNQGRLLDRSHDSQILRAKAMSFVEATIVTTNTRELDFVVQELAARGQAISEEILHHITPLGWKHINLTGQYFWDKRQSMKNVGANLERPKLLV